MLYAAVTGVGGSTASAGSGSSSAQIAEGKDLFDTSCSSCHGLDAQGSSVAPSLIGAGAAAVDFQVGTGRMPLKEIGAEAAQKPPVFNQQQIYAIAAYVASLGGGPAIPTDQQVSTAGADAGTARACSTRTVPVPQLQRRRWRTDRRQVRPAADQRHQPADLRGHADRPEAMPVFNDETLPSATSATSSPTSPRRAPRRTRAGSAWAGSGRPPRPGRVAGGIGALVLAAMWITAKRREERTGDHG